MISRGEMEAFGAAAHGKLMVSFKQEVHVYYTR